jgi:hypothetical protein
MDDSAHKETTQNNHHHKGERRKQQSYIQWLPGQNFPKDTYYGNRKNRQNIRHKSIPLGLFYYLSITL